MNTLKSLKYAISGARERNSETLKLTPPAHADNMDGCLKRIAYLEVYVNSRFLGVKSTSRNV